jgi:hypothetical protein
MKTALDPTATTATCGFRVLAFLVAAQPRAAAEHLPNEMLPIRNEGFSIQIARLRAGPVLTIEDSRQRATMAHSPPTLTEKLLESVRELTAFTAQDQRHVSRLIERSDLVAIAYGGSTIAHDVAQGLERLSAVLGIDTLMFPLEPGVEPGFEPFRASFRSTLRPECAVESVQWMHILAAILHLSHSDGLICLDWNDMVGFFDKTPQATWCVSQGANVESAASLALERLQTRWSQGRARTLMLILLGEGVSMRTIKHSVSAARKIVPDVDHLLIAAPTLPWNSPQVITLTG